MDLNELKYNRRLIEVRTAYTLNRIYNYINRKNFKEHLILLECLAESIDEANKDVFLDLVKNSVGENILGASKKEILASVKVYDDKPKKIIEKLGLSSAKYYGIYGDLKDRNFINETFVNDLKPVLDENGTELCKVINNFVDNFKYLTGEDYYDKYDNPRTLELEFMIIYNKIIEIVQSPRQIETFIYKLCCNLDIDWSTISYLVRNINFINRTNTNQIMGKQQTRLELFNLFYLKGFSKGEIGKVIFNRDNRTFYHKSYESSTRDITKNEWEFNLTYCPTLDWSTLNKDEVLKFISLFKGFVDANL